MRVRLTIDVPLESLRGLKRRDNLSGRVTRDIIAAELQTVVHAHLEDLAAEELTRHDTE